MDYAAWAVRHLIPLDHFGFLPTRRVSDLKTAPIVVIGCDTGIARAALERLIRELKYERVYAGCLTQSSATEIETQLKCRSFQIDVCDVLSVERAALFLDTQEPNGVFAVANVAGAMMGGPIEWTKQEVFRAEIELNYFGLLNVAKAFMPALKRYQRAHQISTRFIGVTSTIAVMPSFPGLSGYAASKAAADTLMNTLRIEVKPFNVDIITVCPGITRTAFLSKGAEQMRRAWATASPQVKAEYGEQYAEWWANTVQFGIDWLAHAPTDAVNCLLDATTAQWPKTRYFCGLDARVIARPAVHLPDFLWDGILGIALRVMGQPSVNSRL